LIPIKRALGKFRQSAGSKEGCPVGDPFCFFRSLAELETSPRDHHDDANCEDDSNGFNFAHHSLLGSKRDDGE
jgi:hypothetical protein